MDLISFKSMKEKVEYKNINTWDDQRYSRRGDELYTKSDFSKGVWSISVASKKQRYFYKATEANGPKRFL